MSRLLFKITDTFSLESFGLVVAVDAKSKDVNLTVNENIEVVLPDGSSFKTKVAAIPMLCPYDSERPFSFSFPKDVKKEDIPIGTEVWFTKTAV